MSYRSLPVCCRCYRRPQLHLTVINYIAQEKKTKSVQLATVAFFKERNRDKCVVGQRLIDHNYKQSNKWRGFLFSLFSEFQVVISVWLGSPTVFRNYSNKRPFSLVSKSLDYLVSQHFLYNKVE